MHSLTFGIIPLHVLQPHRIVNVDLANPGSPDTWSDVVPQHHKDLLQWAVALKVRAKVPTPEAMSMRLPHDHHDR
jgi:hypothetical protein